MGRSVCAVGVALLAVAAACGRAPPPATPPPAPTPSATGAASTPSTAPATAQAVVPKPTVGALFLGGTSLHTCTAAVVHSTAGNLILTAAHCLADGYDIAFVPGLSGAAAPENTFKIDAVYLDPRWVASKDPLADYAIARVAREDGGPVESPAGSGLSLGRAPAVGTVVSVTGYELGAGGDPIGCQVATAMAPGGYPSLVCGGLVDGTSGAPWIAGSTVMGLVGGLDGGGCPAQDISYSPPFDEQTTGLLARAEDGGVGDSAPEVFDDDCG